MPKKEIRQAMFNEAGIVSDIPAKDTEQPQLEKQTDIFTYLKEQQLLNRLKDNEVRY
jgi:hypothetical protein